MYKHKITKRVGLLFCFLYSLCCVSQQWGINLCVDNKLTYSNQKGQINPPTFLKDYPGSWHFASNSPLYSSNLKFCLSAVFKKKDYRIELGVGRDRSMQSVKFYHPVLVNGISGQSIYNGSGSGTSECNFEKLFLALDKEIQNGRVVGSAFTKSSISMGLELVTVINPQKYYGFSQAQFVNNSNDTLFVRNGEIATNKFGFRFQVGISTAFFNKKEKEILRLKFCFVSNSSQPIIFQFAEYTLNRELIFTQHRPVSIWGIYLTLSKDLIFKKKK